MVMQQHDDLVTDFIINQQPSLLLHAYKFVASLNYPISDKHSLNLQLDEIRSKDSSTGKQEKQILGLIEDRMEPTDFPIETPRSGLEKFHARLSSTSIIEPPFRWPLTRFTLDVGPFLQRPERNVLAEYVQRFGVHCGYEAYQTYLDAHGLLTDSDSDEVNAYFAGLRAGRACSMG